jgi:hypothetical protein
MYWRGRRAAQLPSASAVCHRSWSLTALQALSRNGRDEAACLPVSGLLLAHRLDYSVPPSTGNGKAERVFRHCTCTEHLSICTIQSPKKGCADCAWDLAAQVSGC